MAGTHCLLATQSTGGSGWPADWELLAGTHCLLATQSTGGSGWNTLSSGHSVNRWKWLEHTVFWPLSQQVEVAGQLTGSCWLEHTVFWPLSQQVEVAGTHCLLATHSTGGSGWPADWELLCGWGAILNIVLLS